MMKVVKHWHRCTSTEALDAPSLEVCKVRLDGVLRNTIKWKMSLPTAEGWTRWTSKVSSNSKPSMTLTADIYMRRRWTHFGGACAQKHSNSEGDAAPLMEPGQPHRWRKPLSTITALPSHRYGYTSLPITQLETSHFCVSWLSKRHKFLFESNLNHTTGNTPRNISVISRPPNTSSTH